MINLGRKYFNCLLSTSPHIFSVSFDINVKIRQKTLKLGALIPFLDHILCLPNFIVDDIPAFTLSDVQNRKGFFHKTTSIALIIPHATSCGGSFRQPVGQSYFIVSATPLNFVKICSCLGHTIQMCIYPQEILIYFLNRNCALVELRNLAKMKDTTPNNLSAQLI